MNIICAKKLDKEANIGLVVSRFNENITSLLYQGAFERLQELAVMPQHITAVWVPGAIEIPIAVQRLAKTQAYEVIICLGAVIRGETSHYDYVCQQVSYGCQQVALQQDIPVIFGILTTENEEQAMARLGGEFGHKGREASDAAYEMISVLRQLDRAV